MRTPMRRRPRPRTQDVPPDTDLGALAERARYIGSPEHKDMPTFAGQPRPRGDASICPRDHNDVDLVTGWLRSSIRAGSVGGPWEDEFPRYVWHQEEEVVFEARLVNRGDGSYKGYPLAADEWPEHMARQR